MPDILPFLKTLLSVPGLSAYEEPAARLIEEKWIPIVNEIKRSRIGSVEALKRGSGPEPRPSLMIATHMDAIGMMVTSTADGLLRLAMVGGVDARVLPGTLVTVHATGGDKPQALPGVVIQPPAKLLPVSLGENPVPLDRLMVDVGLLPKQVQSLVRIGDLVSYATEPVELAGDVICGHTLDNRASVAALTVALEELKIQSHAWDVWAVATVQEEVTYGGGYTSAFGLRPDMAVVIDVTFAKGPGANDWSTHPLGKGVGIGLAPNVHPFLYKKFKELAERLEIPHEVDLSPRPGGTDGFATQVTAEGIPTMNLSIPLRYMHTPVELVSVKDINRTGRLLAEFIASLEPDFVSKITWED